MAIVVYKCDTCKRNIELQRNIEGLERIQRCTITHGCRGKMFQTEVLDDYIRGSLPEDVSGLDNWIPRKVLHNHQQAIERLEWIIEHNMGSYPTVSVFVDRPIEGDEDNREEITPTDVRIIDEDALVLVFDRPWSGIAQLVARQSDPDLLQPFERRVDITTEPVQLSLNGEISIATLNETLGVGSTTPLNLQYDTSSGPTSPVLYIADDQPSLDSAWLDFDKVIIDGKIYTVRSFNGIIVEMASGVINSGSTFFFTNVAVGGSPPEFRTPNPGEVLILLASEPYDRVDKQRDRFIDVTDVTLETNPFDFYYDNGEFYANESVVQTVYPYIRPI